MKLGIYSLQRILYQGNIVSITCPTTSGEITVLRGHLPLISVLKKGVIKIIDDSGKEEYIEVSSGLIEVALDNQARVLVESEN